MAKTNQQVAIEVIAGKWSTGAERRKKLEKAGYNPDAVQSIVNALMAGCEVATGNLMRVEIDLQKYDGLEVIIK